MIKGKKINKPPHRPRVLVASLDWGLGHATRCIPIIKELESQGCEVILAASGSGFCLLKKEFSSTVILRVYGYKIYYSRNKNWLLFKLFIQVPKLISTIFREHHWLKKTVKKYKPDVVISDNRFGMYNKNIVSVYITHQLAIKGGTYFTNTIAGKIHNQFIKKYDQCWVPDFEKEGLAGDLSHPGKLQSNVKYIGPLSRFEKISGLKKIYDVLVSISGPEPQRTLFENIIFDQLTSYHKKVLLVRGLPAEKKALISPNSLVEIINHLPGEELNKAFQQSDIIICRSGYTTIMDLIKIGKEAILVPTPGQKEQEYLAAYLMKKNFFFSVTQKDFSLEKAIIKASSFPFSVRQETMNDYKKVIAEFVLSVKSGKFASQ